MSLKIPNDAMCNVAGCRSKPTHLLSLRMRRKDTGADWAPNTAAYFCEWHAIGGARINVDYEPNDSGQVEITVSSSAQSRSATRTTPIRG